jgi:hypothetical protein
VNSINWLLRGILGLAGAILAYQAWPVTRGAWEAIRADGVVGQMRSASQFRDSPPVKLTDVLAGIAALDRATAADPVAGRYLQRSELVVGAALTPDLNVSVAQRVAWLRAAESDLVAGLGAAPARGIAWARLAAVRQGLRGSSRGVVDALLMSIDTAPMLNTVWPSRLRLILDNWVTFTPAERERVSAVVAEMWRLSPERLWFAYSIRTQSDELLVRYFLRGIDKALDELTAMRRNMK